MSKGKKTTKKAVAKKTVTKKIAAKKAPVKKVTVKKIAAKKAPAKKVTVKKVAAKKVPAKKVTVEKTGKKTTLFAKCDVGFGNALFIRGEEAELSWEQGFPMENISTDEWKWSTTLSVKSIDFKLLINDHIWSNGENFVAKGGEVSIVQASF